MTGTALAGTETNPPPIFKKRYALRPTSASSRPAPTESKLTTFILSSEDADNAPEPILNNRVHSANERFRPR